tara:strand:- start:2169 stop:2384 length:216 start_codon:yes stop_codon:yes gene_type:complete
MSINKGNLIYVPSDVVLCKYDKKNHYVSEYVKIESPVHLLVTENTDDLYEVLFKDQRWYVKKAEVYEAHDE